MSIEAMNWAFGLAIKPATRKFVLVALATYADPEGVAWPSVAALEVMTCLDRKTIIAAIDALEGDGLLCDTGRRKGATANVKVYRLAIPAGDRFGSPTRRSPDAPTRSSEAPTSPKEYQKRDGSEQYRKRNSTENGTVPFFRGNSTENGTLNSTENGTRNNQGTIKERREKEREESRPPAPPSKPASRGCRIPAGFTPNPEDVATISAQCPELDIDRATVSFCDYWAAVPGAKGTKLDWRATWRNSMRQTYEMGKCLKTGPRRVGATGRSHQAEALAAVDAATRDLIEIGSGGF